MSNTWVNHASKWMFAFTMLCTFSNWTVTSPADRLLGVWESVDRDMRVEMYRKGNQYAGRVVWFLCEPTDTPMARQLDSENPDPLLRQRHWLGMDVVDKLRYAGDNEWNGGKVYDPNAGRTYDTVVWLNAKGDLTVRGYWKVQWLGKSLHFTPYKTGR